MANPLKHGEDLLRIEKFPRDLKKECKKIVVDCDMTLKGFVIKWMKVGLKQERKALASKKVRALAPGPVLKNQR